MNLKDFQKCNLPDEPGVYFFRKGNQKNSEILYIGKATSLRDRVRSYFSNDLIKTRGPAIVDMVTKSKTVTFQKTNSVLEALIMEANLIKKYQPKYNTKEKDDRSYHKIIITDEEYPRVLVIREKELQAENDKYKIKKEFGPYPNAGQLNEALKIIRKIFPFFDTKKKVAELTDRDKKLMNLKISIGIYPDIFSGQVTKKEYLQNIKNIESFLSGNKNKILKDLEKQMKKYSNQREFEKANDIKEKIFALNHINDVNLIKEDSVKSSGENYRVEAYDIAHTRGDSSVGVFTVFEESQPKKSDYRKFILRNTKKSDDYGGLKETLSRRFKHLEWKLPNLIVVDGGEGQKRIASQIAKSINPEIEVVSVVKDDKHKAKNILGKQKIVEEHKNSILQSNLEAHRFAIAFHRKKLRKRLK